MSNPQRFIRPLALVIAALLVLGGTGLLMAKSRAENEKYHITAYFTKAIGLFENSDVDILGVPVGKVTEIVPEGTQVRVEMEIDSKYKIEKSAETFAQIVPISVISDRYVQLGPVYLDEGEFLADGDVLDTSVTQIPAELDDVFKQLKKLLDAIEPGKEGEPGALGELIVQLNQTLDNRERDLQGTLIHGAELTSTLADAQEDLSGILINLDNLFTKLATRADSMSELNRNFALVMTALAESRSDLEGTLANLGDMTTEVGDLVTQHGDRLGRDLTLASNITSTVLKNRASVEESLEWLKVVGQGLAQAYHPGPQDDVDVRDNANAKIECELLDVLPPGPVTDQLRDICEEETGEPDATSRATTPDAPEDALDCDKGVRQVRRQLKRLEKAGIPDAALDEVLDPLREKLKELKKECKKLGEAAEDPESILDDLPPVPDLDVPGVDLGLDELSGNAAPAAGSAGTAPTSAEPSEWDRFTDWTGSFFSFLGVGG
jgi:phospholipid/cholesterol/gamma-HCH transport system substrate-binding protein